MTNVASGPPHKTRGNIVMAASNRESGIPQHRISAAGNALFHQIALCCSRAKAARQPAA